MYETKCLHGDNLSLAVVEDTGVQTTIVCSMVSVVDAARSAPQRTPRPCKTTLAGRRGRCKEDKAGEKRAHVAGERNLNGEVLRNVAMQNLAYLSSQRVAHAELRHRSSVDVHTECSHEYITIDGRGAPGSTKPTRTPEPRNTKLLEAQQRASVRAGASAGSVSHPCDSEMFGVFHLCPENADHGAVLRTQKRFEADDSRARQEQGAFLATRLMVQVATNSDCR